MLYDDTVSLNVMEVDHEWWARKW